ncbi:MAG: NAD(+) diphosphatase [Rhodospirillales bacterium]
MSEPSKPPVSLHYTGGSLNRAVERRDDDAWIAERLSAANSRVVPLWRNRNLISSATDPMAVFTEGEHAKTFLELAETIALLGIDPISDTAIFAADLSAHEDNALATLMNGASFLDLREVGPVMNQREANLLAYARGVMYWHRRQRFCGNCGHPTESRKGGHMRKCTNERCGREHYPRTDPAVIMLVTRETSNGDVCLLAHKNSFPQGRFSVLAGYVDPGESLEEAVAREVLEEVGVIVTEVTYKASQPWPFPSSLMLGFRARAVSEEIVCDQDEIEEAFWFSREDLADFPDKGYQLSRPDSIARWLIDEWIAEGR